MPVWHEQTREAVKAGRLAVVGVIQEQHPERCQLFAQWQQFDWPILHDPINVLNTTAVPIVIAIDEHGIVRSTRPKPETFESTFLSHTFSNDASAAQPSLTPSQDINQLRAHAQQADSSGAWQTLGDSLSLWRSPQRVAEAIQAYDQALIRDPNDLQSHFRRGVCLRMQFESSGGNAEDFARAVAAWETALAGNPNQYIWRRRIQQYGPRLLKPYPFYDWVDQAEVEIRARGEGPIRLPVRPTGAEIASPSRDFDVSESVAAAPDPNCLIMRDSDNLIRSSVTFVPTRAVAGETVRVHVQLTPNRQRQAHWNNEADPLQLWVEPANGARASRQLLVGEAVREPVSLEVRRFDFELEIPADAGASIECNAYALYYVCEEVDGQCRYLRQDIPIRIQIDGKGS